MDKDTEQQDLVDILSGRQQRCDIETFIRQVDQELYDFCLQFVDESDLPMVLDYVDNMALEGRAGYSICHARWIKFPKGQIKFGQQRIKHLRHKIIELEHIQKTIRELTKNTADGEYRIEVLITKTS